MTSTLAPFGFRAARRIGGAPNGGAQNRYRVNPAGYAANMFSGDPVKIGSTGYVTQASLTTDFALGVVTGFLWNDPVTKRPTWSQWYPANTSVGTDPQGITAFVNDDPYATFLIQANASVTVQDVGYNFEVTNAGGSTITGISGFTVKATSRSVTTNMVRLVDIFETPDNSFGSGTGGQYPIIEVKFVQDQQFSASVVP